MFQVNLNIYKCKLINSSPVLCIQNYTEFPQKHALTYKSSKQFKAKTIWTKLLREHTVLDQIVLLRKSFSDDILKSIWKEMKTGNIYSGMRKTNLSKHKPQISFLELQGSNTCDSEPIEV